MLLIIRVISAKITNKLINKNVYYESNIKTIQSRLQSILISKMLRIQLQNIQV